MTHPIDGESRSVQHDGNGGAAPVDHQQLIGLQQRPGPAPPPLSVDDPLECPQVLMDAAEVTPTSREGRSSDSISMLERIGSCSGNSAGGAPNESHGKSYVPTGTNLFIAGVPSHWDAEKLREIFSPFGDVASVKVVNTRHYAFVQFRTAEQADHAMRAMHLQKPLPTSPNTQVLHISVALHDEGAEEVPNERLFIRGLPPWVTREEVTALFRPFGTLTELTILYAPGGGCKGAAFVQFATIEESTRAMNEIQGKRLPQWTTPLEIRFSESKEVRSVRQKGTRERMRTSTGSTPSSSGNSTGNVVLPLQPLPLVMLPGVPPGAPSPYGVAGQPVPLPQAVLGTPPGVPLAYAAATSPAMLAVSFPPPSSVAQGPPPGAFMQVAADGSLLPVALQQMMLPFPASGDILLHGPPLTEGLATQLVSQFGQVEMVQAITNGVVMRLKDRGLHPLVAQKLSGLVFPSGYVLQVAVVQM